MLHIRLHPVTNDTSMPDVALTFVRRLKKKSVASVCQKVTACFASASAANHQPVESMWHVWWTKWHWDIFLSKYFGVSPVSVIPPVLHTHSFICHRRYTNLATGSVLLSKPLYCCVLRKAVYRTDTWKLPCALSTSPAHRVTADC